MHGLRWKGRGRQWGEKKAGTGKGAYFELLVLGRLLLFGQIQLANRSGLVVQLREFGRHHDEVVRRVVSWLDCVGGWRVVEFLRARRSAISKLLWVSEKERITFGGWSLETDRLWFVGIKVVERF